MELSDLCLRLAAYQTVTKTRRVALGTQAGKATGQDEMRFPVPRPQRPP